jgi:hypothetical protein
MNIVLDEILLQSLLFQADCYPRKIRLIESNTKYRHLYEAQNPIPPTPLHTRRGWGRVKPCREKGRGALVHKAGSKIKYQHD